MAAAGGLQIDPICAPQPRDEYRRPTPTQIGGYRAQLTAPRVPQLAGQAAGSALWRRRGRQALERLSAWNAQLCADLQ